MIQKSKVSFNKDLAQEIKFYLKFIYNYRYINRINDIDLTFVSNRNMLEFF